MNWIHGQVAGAVCVMALASRAAVNALAGILPVRSQSFGPSRASWYGAIGGEESDCK